MTENNTNTTVTDNAEETKVVKTPKAKKAAPKAKSVKTPKVTTPKASKPAAKVATPKAAKANGRLRYDDARAKVLSVLASGPATKISLFRMGFYQDCTKLFRDLESDGLIKARKPEEGERVVLWELTAKGRKAAGK